MAFVKLVKNKAYFKRFQVKYRRRREGKTDYFARRKLVVQDKNKYGAKKYRFVCRVTASRIICQITYATLLGDKVMCEANSRELARYGVTVGFTNYPAAYATGLLLARRLLKQVGLDKYEGVKKADGQEYHIEEAMADEERRPFKCVLDVGITRTTVGNKIFGAMKGACDGGLHIPHSTKCFPGYTKGEDGGKYDPEVHKARIFGNHIGSYMKAMLEETPDKYEQHFSQFVKAKVRADDLEKMYRTAHEGIRKNPDRPAKKARAHAPVKIREGDMIKTTKGQYRRQVKLSCEERKARVQRKMAIVVERMKA